MNLYKMWKPAVSIVVILVVALLLIWVWPIYTEVQAMKAPNYEQGAHKGARYCGQCHQKIYNDWSTRSLHALATTKESYQDYLIKFKANYLLNTFITDAVCFACHGDKTSTEGVNCEVCHGTVIADVPIMDTHKLKYQPELKALRKKDFCAKCHDLRSPLSHDGIFTVQGEWRNSRAASSGQTCQSCHMPKNSSGMSYHGFDSAHRDVTIYKDDIRLRNVKLHYPRFSLEIENLITGHAVPPSGPGRIMVLEITFLDTKGEKLHRVQEAFGKKFQLMPIAGLFPNRLIHNTQLKSGERRTLSFTLPNSLNNKISKAVVSLRFYAVSDEHQGNIKHAHWISKPFLLKEFKL